MSNPRSSTASLVNGQPTGISSRATSSHPQSVDEVISDINTAIDRLSDKFNNASQEFFVRLDEISSRLDSIEQSITAAHVSADGGDDAKRENGAGTPPSGNMTRNSA